MNGFFPNCCEQCASAVTIDQHITNIDKLMEENKHMSSIPVIKGSKQPRNEMVMRTRHDEIEKIWECLSRRDDVNVICIHGIAGVGKTAVAEAIYNQALQDKDETFDYIIWVAADYGIQLKSLHKKIARSLNISLPDTSDDAHTAARLREELVQRKKCLVILDFLWEDFSLREMGIPERVDHKDITCKVILTSRSRSSCPNIVKNELFEIRPLSEDDTLAFFKSFFGISRSSMEKETLDLMDKVVKDCEGIPYAVFMLTMYLKEKNGQSMDEMGSTLKEMLNGQVKSTTSTNMFKCLEYSYDRLDNRSQQCFCYCTLYPKGYPMEVEELIDHWVWEGLLDNYIISYEERRRMGMEVLRTLKDARLLETVDSNSSKEVVKMLGLFHEMAVHISNREGLGLLTRAGCSLFNIPTLDDQQGDIQRASFMHNQVWALKNKPNCPNMSTLLLQNNPLDKISTNFFSQIPNLKFLDLSYTRIYFLPPEACTLNHLQVLLLHHCRRLKTLPSLSKLRQLMVLDLSRTSLQELPSGIKKLKNLRHLNLSHTKLTKFPAGLISALASLQEFLIMMDNVDGYS